MRCRAACAMGFLAACAALSGSRASAASVRLIDRPGGVAAALAACWHPPHEGDEITTRLSFRRDGSVFGKPRITYMKAAGGADGEAALATSLIRAVASCAPLRFTPALGEAIAGRVLLIRFVAPRREQRA